MPLSEKLRAEVYVPDLPIAAYQKLLEALEEEFTYTCGGCTVNRGLAGSYLSRAGRLVQDRIVLLYADAPLALSDSSNTVSGYADSLRNAAFRALNEEAVLVTVAAIYHSE